MLTKLAGGHVVDPANGVDSVGDIWIENGRIVRPPADGVVPGTTHDLSGCVVMAGAIDIHSHIAGANVNTSRLLLPELRGTKAEHSVPICDEIGRLYAKMGYTTVVEPAISPHVAVQAHVEIARIPLIDTAILAVLGNDDFLLGLMRAGEGPRAIADYAGRTLSATRALGLKVVNPGGAAAFKQNVRSFSLDDEIPGSGITSRQIIHTMQAAADDLGVPHPLHLHCNNLGMPGNVETALATIEAAEGRRLHLAHLQFYAYGTDGARGFSSAAPKLAAAVNLARNITADVGQVMFGQTVTVSSDVMRQFNSRGQAHPRKSAILDGDGNGGGIVPYRYRRGNYFNAVQWAAGLELFLLIDDPWRVFMTTDHPNGGPFTSYPDLIALLMSRDLRSEWITSLPKDAMEVSTLASIQREYSLVDIATMTRAAPARLLGLADRGHLGPGARADVAVYAPQANKATMFRDAELVLRDGHVIVKRGEIVGAPVANGIAVAAKFDAAIDRRLATFYHDIYGVSNTLFDVPDAAALYRHAAFDMIECRS